MTQSSLRATVMRLVSALLIAATYGAESALAQKGTLCPPRDSVRWSPVRPRAGTVFTLEVSGISQRGALGGFAAGEPVHFRQDLDDGDRWRAFAAVPIDSTKGIDLLLSCASDDALDTLVIRIPAVAGAYGVDRLRVAPQFGAPPDSALAERIRREGERAASVSEGSHATPRLWEGPFLAPRAARITSSFGRAREFNGTITSRHMGTDYAGTVGAPIRAANRGVVRLTGEFYYGGNVVYLDHGEGIVTAYLHMSERLVAEGDTVPRGAVIGRVGATGRVTGPHLHFIVRYGRVTVDPIRFLAVTVQRDKGLGDRLRGNRE